MTKHVLASGLVGGYSVCGSRDGTLVYNADEADCVDCIQKLINFCKCNPGYKYTEEIKRAADNLDLAF